MRIRVPPIASALFVVLLLAGCAASGPSDEPIARNLTWFSYLGGDDIRAACVPGMADRYRLVYNARYSEQVRSYDIVTLPATGGALMSVRVRGALRLSALDLADPLSPWRSQESRRRIAPAQLDELVAALARSGAFDPAPPGRQLNSKTYYWVVTTCRAGHFTLSVFDNPAPDLGRPAFVKPLARLDPSPVPFARPRPLDGLPPRPAQCGSRRGGPREECFYPPFVIETGENGLVPGLAL